MLPRPAIRNSRSVTSSKRAKARFTPRGYRKGAIPSKTKNSARAASRSVKFRDTDIPSRSVLAGGARVPQVLEELALRSDDEQVAILAERTFIRLQASIEGVELGILGVGLRIRLRRLRISLTANSERIALRVCQNLRA